MQEQGWQLLTIEIRKFVTPMRPVCSTSSIFKETSVPWVARATRQY